MTGRRSLIALGVLAVLLVAGAAQALEVGQKAPDFSLPGPGNKPVTLSELSDFRRTMLPQYDALELNEQSPIFRYSKRAYFVIDREGVVRYKKIQPNALDLLKPEEVLQAFKDSGAK